MPDDVRHDDINYKIGDDRPRSWQLLERAGETLAADGFTARAQVRLETSRPGEPPGELEDEEGTVVTFVRRGRTSRD